MSAIQSIPLDYYIYLSAALFSMGVMGVLFRRNAIIIFMSIELLLNASNIVFIAFSRFRGALDGQVVSFFVIAVAAAEAAVGLAIVIAIFRNRGTVKVDELNLMRN